MDFRVVFSPTSIRDLGDSVRFIARHDRDAALHIGDSLIDTAESLLASQPFVGPECPEYVGESIRYWLHRNYRIVYEVDEDSKAVYILRFWHCARGDWPIDLE